MNHSHFSPTLGALLTLAAALAAAPPWAVAKAAAPSAKALYQRDIARCGTQRPAAERDNCLSEASTANQARLPAVVDTDPGRYARNALLRCQVLKGADRQDCVSRMHGAGTTSGSVAEGGIYRELVTLEAAPADAPAAR
jgi:hypothetical protein